MQCLIPSAIRMPGEDVVSVKTSFSKTGKSFSKMLFQQNKVSAKRK
jgi:hypothetical protein